MARMAALPAALSGAPDDWCPCVGGPAKAVASSGVCMAVWPSVCCCGRKLRGTRPVNLPRQSLPHLPCGGRFVSPTLSSPNKLLLWLCTISSSPRLGASPVESETHKVGARQPAFACISLHKLRRCPPGCRRGGLASYKFGVSFILDMARCL
eukprot:scaffold9419_cov120-Isochrysis_galbana.AAC.2